MRELATIITLALAETSFFFGLQDYDNTTIYNDPPGDPAIEVPSHRSVPRSVLRDRWQGPYTAFNNYISIMELEAARPEMITTPSRPGGPIFADTNPAANELHDKYPLDPWGGPYLFFEPGALVIPGITLLESNYATPVIFSMGPNGLPGDLTVAPGSYEYLREAGIIGTGDDFTWNF